MALASICMDWIITGSSASGRPWTKRLVNTYPDAVRIAANLALTWYEADELELDFAFLFDQVACERYAALAYKFQQDGTRLVTLKRDEEALKRRGVDRFDEFIPPARFKCKPDWFARGEWNDMGLSGLWSVQYAINSGATTLHLPGHEGYRAHEHPNAAAKTFGVIEPAFRAMAGACPDVQFVFYGDLAYQPPQYHNVTTIKAKATESAAA